ncbi:MAG: hypothetical protein Q9221_008897 [Calogaya cf. arnoldii]
MSQPNERLVLHDQLDLVTLRGPEEWTRDPGQWTKKTTNAERKDPATGEIHHTIPVAFDVLADDFTDTREKENKRKRLPGSLHYLHAKDLVEEYRRLQSMYPYGYDEVVDQLRRRCDEVYDPKNHGQIATEGKAVGRGSKPSASTARKSSMSATTPRRNHQQEETEPRKNSCTPHIKLINWPPQVATDMCGLECEGHRCYIQDEIAECIWKTHEPPVDDLRAIFEVAGKQNNV